MVAMARKLTIAATITQNVNDGQFPVVWISSVAMKGAKPPKIAVDTL
jgi:hypothetical protein